MAAAEQWPRPKAPLSPATAGPGLKAAALDQVVHQGVFGLPDPPRTIRPRDAQEPATWEPAWVCVRQPEAAASMAGPFRDTSSGPWSPGRYFVSLRPGSRGGGGRVLPAPPRSVRLPLEASALALRKELERPSSHGSPDGRAVLTLA